MQISIALKKEQSELRLLFFMGGATHTFVISQEIASCEIKSLRRDAQLAERKLLTQPARARNKSCAAKVVARRVCEAHFCSASAPGAHTKKLIVFST